MSMAGMLRWMIRLEKEARSRRRMGEKEKERFDLFSWISFNKLAFQCQICHKWLKRGEKMSKHIGSHKFETPLECSYPGCNQVRCHIIKWYLRTVSSNIISDCTNEQCHAATCSKTPQEQEQQTNTTIDIKQWFEISLSKRQLILAKNICKGLFLCKEVSKLAHHVKLFLIICDKIFFVKHNIIQQSHKL